MTAQTLEFITDAELIAASGGGWGAALGTALRTGRNYVKNHPDKVIEAASTVDEALTSKCQLQNLYTVIA